MADVGERGYGAAMVGKTTLTHILGSIVIASTGAGCGGSARCLQPWSDLDVDSSLAEDPETAEERWQRGLSRFRSWTQREETCLETARLVNSDFSDEWSGLYEPEERRVTIEAPTATANVAHELCHALDHEEGNPSETAGDALGTLASAIDSADLYEDEDARLREAFARQCEQGPETWAALLALEEVCPTGLDLDAAEFVLSVAFPESLEELDTHSGPRYRLSQTDTVVTEVGPDLPMGLVQSTLTEFGVLLQLTSYDEDTALYTPSLALVDPDEGVLLDTLELPSHELATIDGHPALSIFSLIPGSETTLLKQVSGDEAGQVWEIALSPLELVSQDESFWSGEEWDQGYAHVDRAMVFEHATGVSIVDLTDESRLLVGEDDPHTFDSTLPDEVYADSEGIILAFERADQLRLVEVDWSGAALWAATLPVPGEQVQTLLREPGGRVVATAATDSGSATSISLLYSPDSGEWTVPADACSGLAAITWTPWEGDLVAVGPDLVGEEEWELVLSRARIEQD